MTCKDTIFSKIYSKLHPDKEPPYYCYYSISTILKKPIRKWFSAIFIPSVPFSNLRVWLYRRCGYKIGKNTFIGMRCYLDDMCYDLIEIGNNVNISYGVFFACHGNHQTHNRLIIHDNAYIGMRAMIIARDNIEIGENSIIGAGTLVNKSIPDNQTAVGIPCRIINQQSSDING